MTDDLRTVHPRRRRRKRARRGKAHRESTSTPTITLPTAPPDLRKVATRLHHFNQLVTPRSA